MKKIGTIFLTLLVSTLLVGVFVPMINKGSGGKLEEGFDKWLGANQPKNPDSGTPTPEKSLYERRHDEDRVYTLDTNQGMREGFYTHKMGNKDVSEVSLIGKDAYLEINCSTIDSEGTVVNHINGAINSNVGDIGFNTTGDFILLTKTTNPKTLCFDINTDSTTVGGTRVIDEKYFSFEIMFHSLGAKYTTTSEVFRASIKNYNTQETTPLFIANAEDVSVEKDKLVSFKSSIKISDYITSENPNITISIDVQEKNMIPLDFMRWSFSYYPFEETEFNNFMQKIDRGEVNFYDSSKAWLYTNTTTGIKYFRYSYTENQIFLFDTQSYFTFAFRDYQKKITLESIESALKKHYRDSKASESFTAKKKHANGWTYYCFQFGDYVQGNLTKTEFELGNDYISSMDLSRDVMFYPSNRIPSEDLFLKFNSSPNPKAVKTCVDEMDTKEIEVIDSVEDNGTYWGPLH